MASFKNFPVQKKSGGFTKTAVGLGIFLAMVGAFYAASASVKGAFFQASSPFQKSMWSAGNASAGFLGAFFKAHALANENSALKQENQKLISKVLLLQAVTNANQAQTDISLSLQPNTETTVASVVGLDAQGIVSVNKGLSDGIRPGMPVVSQYSALIGKVERVYEGYSHVMLVSHPSSTVNVKVVKNTESGEEAPATVEGVLRGQGGLRALLDLVPVESDLRVGDVVASSALEKIVPKNLVVGQVDRIERNDQKPFQQAEISLFFDVSHLDTVFLITNYGQEP